MTFGPVLGAALAAQAACNRLGLRACVIGGVALQRWGALRFTADVDLSVLVESGDEAQVTEALLAELPARMKEPELAEELERRIARRRAQP